MPINKIRHFSYLLMIFGAFCTDHLQASKFTEVLEVASKKLVNYNKQYAWRDNQVHSYTKDNFELLLENKIPAVKISNFLSSKESKSLATLIKKNGFSFYENVSPPIGRIGITQFEHSSKNKSLYFQQVASASKARDRIFREAGTEVIEKVRNTLSQEMKSYSVEIPYEPNEGTYFAGLIRQIGKADLHFDWAPYDAPDWTIGGITSQIAWNIYVETPEEGGECIVYDKRWEPKIYEQFLSDNNNKSYGFKKELVEGNNFVNIKPSVGDLVFFNSRNFHEVLNSKDNQDIRISISSFVGKANQNLWLWS